MKPLVLVGVILFALGLAGVIWGLVEMHDDRDVIDFGGGSQIVLDKGDFPPIGIAGAIAAGIGALLIGAGVFTSRKS